MKLDGLRPAHAEPYAVTHDLQLSHADLVAIASRHKGSVEQHRSDIPLLLPSGRRRALEYSPVEAVEALAETPVWVTLFGVQSDPLMRVTAAQLQALMGADVELVLSLICSSSSGVTPAHMDVYDVLLLQLSGEKCFGTGGFSARADREAALRRRFSADRENLSELPDEQQEWALAPGRGVVVPAYTPHWATIGDEVSVALSVAMTTPALHRRHAEHVADAALLRRHIRLPAPGRSKLIDGARVAVHSAGRRLR